MAQVASPSIPAWTQVEKLSATWSIVDIASYLQEALGQQMVAFLAGVSSSVMVSRWIHGGVAPSQVRQMRLRYAFRCARIIEDAYGAETTRAWFYGTNTYLNDEAPASVLRRATSIKDLQSVYEASRIFVTEA